LLFLYNLQDFLLRDYKEGYDYEYLSLILPFLLKLYIINQKK
jgi:hypothetical protein